MPEPGKPRRQLLPANAFWMRIGELSRQVGVSTDTLRAWERRYGLLKPRRTRGNARLYSSLDEARVRVMKRYIDQRIPPAQAAQLSLSARFALKAGDGEEPSAHDIDQAGAEMRRALDTFDEVAADQALHRLLVEHSTSAVIRHVILPYLHDIGERWAGDHTTVTEEHFASNFLHFRLATLSRGWDRGLGPRALLACAPDEQHTIGLIAFGIALHQHGWRISYLGAATPTESLRRGAVKLEPELITVCAYTRRRLEPHLDALGEIGARWPLALAGGAVEEELADRCHAIHLAEDPVSAAAAVALAA